MEILVPLTIMIFLIYFVFKKVIYSAKRNLFKDQEAWSGKDIKIKYSQSKEISESKRNDNYLKMIAAESKFYLEDQSKNDSE